MSGADETTPSRVVAGRYRLESVLGRGGMGVVWLAVDTLIERRVALKELRAPAVVPEGEASSFVERALREARSAGRLNHPGVVAVHDVIAPTGDDDAVYIVMEYVQAPTLGDLLDQDEPLPAARVATIGLGVLAALDAAHGMGIVHRDIKPSNVLVADGDRVKLTDFGIALAAEDTTRLTRSGVIGTHAYLAPECFDAGQAGPAADLWALGATLFHAVAGRAPFDRDTTTATLRAILFEDPPAPPCEPALAEVITGLLTRPVEQRLTSDAAQQRLHHVVATTPTVDAPPTGGADQAAWEAQATSVHRPPTAPPPAQPAAQPWGQPTQPQGPPSPYGTTQPAGPPGAQTTQPGGQPSPYGTTQPAGPAGAQTTQPGGQPPPYGMGSPTQPGTPLPGPGGPATSPYPGSGPGLPRQAGPGEGATSGASWAGSPPRRNNTPWLVGGVAAAVVALLLIVVLASSGGDDSGSESGTDSATPGVSDTPPDDSGELGGGGASAAEQQDPQGAADGQALAQSFLDVVNGGNTDAAIDLLCTVGDNQDKIDNITAVAGNADLQIDTATAEIVDDVVYSVDLTGSIDGESISYGHVGTAFEDGCVVSFSAITD